MTLWRGKVKAVKYEYKVIPYELVIDITTIRENESDSKAASRFENWLNILGKEGWQFVGKGELSYCFMREMS